MLFEERWTSIEEQKKADFLDSNLDLAKLGDEQIRKAFRSISPKSDWERFFVDKITEIDVKSLIDNIRLSRNSIAHCKFFYKQEYRACLKSLTRLKKALDKAIKLTEEIDFSKKNAENLRASLAGISMIFADFQKTAANAMEPIIQKATEVSKLLQPAFEGIGKFVIEYQTILQRMNLATYENYEKIPPVQNVDDDL